MMKVEITRTEAEHLVDLLEDNPAPCTTNVTWRLDLADQLRAQFGMVGRDGSPNKQVQERNQG